MDKWLEEVARLLVSRRTGVNVNQIEGSCLASAYKSGISPIQFVMAGNFSLKQVPAPTITSSPRKKWTLKTTLILMLVVAGSYIVIDWIQVKKELKETKAQLAQYDQENNRLVNEYNGLVDRHNSMVDRARSSLFFRSLGY